METQLLWVTPNSDIFIYPGISIRDFSMPVEAAGLCWISSCCCFLIHDPTKNISQEKKIS